MNKIKENIRSVFAWFFGLLVFFFGGIILFAIGFFHTGKVFEWVLKITCRWIVYCVGIRLQISGLENIDPQKQYILMMNHVNSMDPFVFYARYPGKARGIEEESHFNWPFYGWLIRRIGQIPISRKDGRKALISLKKAGELIRSHKDISIMILPEGTRTLTGKLGEFKKGGFLIALEAGLDILPMIQIGAFEFKRKGSWLLRPGIVRVVIEKPISTSGYSRKNMDDLIAETQNVFLKYVEPAGTGTRSSAKN
ncbi:MAG: 1-acyl-sn-glycerol-3-phosphate acyltransferase [Acidobacteria bacterium]|jgi:1-acyl-sn-glycerol-3-phosphate acyltransferase|nr:1-acyl-sn-glycerol-3-phosphate acyltransferase [Acidobacteriota bacterium]